MTRKLKPPLPSSRGFDIYEGKRSTKTLENNSKPWLYCAAKNPCGEVIIWERASNTCSINKWVQMHCLTNIYLLPSTESCTNTKGSGICSFTVTHTHIPRKTISVCREQPFFQRCDFSKAFTDLQMRWPTQLYSVIPEAKEPPPEELSSGEQTETSHPVLTASLPATRFTVDNIYICKKGQTTRSTHVNLL